MTLFRTLFKIWREVITKLRDISVFIFSYSKVFLLVLKAETKKILCFICISIYLYIDLYIDLYIVYSYEILDEIERSLEGI